MKPLIATAVLTLASCATTPVTTTDSKGAVVVTKTTQPPAGVVTAIATVIGGALDAAINSLVTPQ